MAWCLDHVAQPRRRALGWAAVAAGAVGAGVWGLLATGADRATATRERLPGAGGLFPGLPAHALDDSPATLGCCDDRLRVVNFWARWCAPCRRELPALSVLARRLADDGIELLTVALDDDAFALREYVRGLGLPGLSVVRWAQGSGGIGAAGGAAGGRRSDAGSAVSSDLRLSSLPQTWAVGRRAEVHARWIGERAWEPSEWVPRLVELDRADRHGLLT